MKIAVGIIVFVLALIEVYNIGRDIIKWWKRMKKPKPLPVSKDWYCDAPEAAGQCPHFKEGYCQFEKGCSRKHPNT
jgi:hypothetical protein